MKENLNNWELLQKMLGLVNKGKEFLRVTKFTEKESLWLKLKLIKKFKETLLILISNKKKKTLERDKIKILENSFNRQKKMNLPKLNLLDFSFNYYVVCKNRFLQFFNFSKIIFRKKKEDFLSGLFYKKDLFKDFLIKKTSERRERELLWQLISSSNFLQPKFKKNKRVKYRNFLEFLN